MKTTPSHDSIDSRSSPGFERSQPRPVLVTINGAHQTTLQKAPCATSVKSDWPHPSWLALLQPAEQEVVLKSVAITPYKRGKQIHHNAVPADCWTGIVTGLVSLSTVSQGGKSVWFGVARPGQWLGEELLLEGLPYSYELIALRDTQIATLNQEVFHKLIDKSPAFARFIVQKLSRRLRRSRTIFEVERSLDATSKVARCIAQLSERIDDAPPNMLIDITQNEIGLLTGVSRQAVNGALQVLEAAGMLKADHGGVRVKNSKQLAEYVHW